MVFGQRVHRSGGGSWFSSLSSSPASQAAGPSGLWVAWPRGGRSCGCERRSQLGLQEAGLRSTVASAREKAPWSGWGGVVGTSFQLPLLTSPQPQAGFALSPQNLSPDKIFHVIVAPCYDKKLEALREDFPTASHGSRGADCVLTSGEGWAGWVRLGPLAGRPLRSRQDPRGLDCREVEGAALAQHGEVPYETETLPTEQTCTWQHSEVFSFRVKLGARGAPVTLAAAPVQCAWRRACSRFSVCWGGNDSLVPSRAAQQNAAVKGWLSSANPERLHFRPPHRVGRVTSSRGQ